MPDELLREPKVVHAPVTKGDCAACHAPHATRQPHLLGAPEREVCAACHRNVEKELAKPLVHAPARDGDCRQCHNPHASDQKGLLVEKDGALCFLCHDAEKDLLKAAEVHPPFADGDCLTCHTSHAAERPGMLRKEARTLCLECHSPGDAGMKKAHPFGVGRLDCGSCHNPHASEQEKLIRDEPHAVFGSCGRCHEPGGKLLAKADDLCLRCHSEVRNELAAPDAHPALAEGCLSCHSPHAADRPGLIRGGSDRVACLSCHQEIEARRRSSFSVHPETGEAGACSSCHTGHRSDQPALLKAAPEKVCESCHKGHAQFGHPIGKGVIDPRTGKDTSCASCHSPHGTGFPALLTHSPQRSLCVQCHAADGTVGTRRGVSGGGMSE